MSVFDGKGGVLCENSMKLEAIHPAWHPQLYKELDKKNDSYDNSWCSCFMHCCLCIPCGIPLCVVCGVGCCLAEIPAHCVPRDYSHHCYRATENTVHWMAASPWFYSCRSKPTY